MKKQSKNKWHYRSFRRETMAAYDGSHEYVPLWPDVLEWLESRNVTKFKILRNDKRKRDAGFAHFLIQEIEIAYYPNKTTNTLSVSAKNKT